jgi:hypothetical protein
MRKRTFEITDTWLRCPECGVKSCRERRKQCVAPQLAGITFVELRCLSCGHQHRSRLVESA